MKNMFKAFNLIFKSGNYHTFEQSNLLIGFAMQMHCLREPGLKHNDHSQLYFAVLSLS